MLYSAQTNGFYHLSVHGDAIPADAIEITDEQHAALLNGQSIGKVIAADAAGHPVLVDPPPAPPPDHEALRRAAYREVSDPLFFKWQRGDATQGEWLAAVAAIKARYPGDILTGQ